MPIIESILVKLTGILSLKKYCSFLKQERVIKDKPPTIVKVLIEDKDAGEDEKRTAQLIVNEILKPPTKQLSYKQKFEELEKRLSLMEVSKDEPKKPVIDSTREQLEAKAKGLNITFRSNLGNEKLLLKIQEIEPEYEI
jgi:hypothetical protein